MHWLVPDKPKDLLYMSLGSQTPGEESLCWMSTLFAIWVKRTSFTEWPARGPQKIRLQQ